MGIQDMMVLKYVEKLEGYLKRIAEASEKSAKENERAADAAELVQAIAECDHNNHIHGKPVKHSCGH